MHKKDMEKKIEKNISPDRQKEIDKMLSGIKNNEVFAENKTLSSSQISKRGKGIEPSMVVEKFTKRYKGSKIPAVENASFKVMPGEFHGFIGANGAGKTTTIKSLIGAYAKFEGSVKMFGHKHSTAEAKKHIGYIPETAKFPKGMSTFKYIAYMSYLSGMSMSKAKKYALSKLEELGMKKVMWRSPNTFSSGQKKKVLLAQALVHDPDIIIMDEPAANLDPKARFEFFEDLKKLQKQGKSIFISSHILAELDKFVDSVTIVDGGTIVFSGSIAEATSNFDLEYLINLDNLDEHNKVIQILKEQKIEYRVERKGIIGKFLNNENIFKFMKNLVDAKIIPETFKNKKMNLEEVYKKYVVLGSRETGTGKAGA
ncbi:ABC transporter ATP-binding protein [Mycoplasma marinum]|uniref:ABC transporter ATP-binding protein n=1 Tax=Mycoplasma marinum TaxID=1937190 RepID=A0A4R0XSG6_9MOLU|nr:ABC transporter ATP-binding protein [Mycoplasma marinum]TCG11370.1 ABC transporter ATP-binding protein [Mycoplasma marinum]